MSNHVPEGAREEALRHARESLGRHRAIVVDVREHEGFVLALIDPMGDPVSQGPDDRFAIRFRSGWEEPEELLAHDYYEIAGLTFVDYDAPGLFFYVQRQTRMGPFTRVRYFAAGDMWIASDWTWDGELIGDATIVDGRGVTAYAEELR